jgi:hypothetical protein
VTYQAPSASTEPYNIKVGDALGVRLGGPFDDLLTVQRGNRKVKRGWTPDTCVQGLDDDVFCSIIPDPVKPPTIGDTKLDFCTVQFYRNEAVNIRYTLAGYDRERLLESLEEKFGTPAHSNSDSRSVWTWRNAVSSLDFEIDKEDHSESRLTLTLPKKSNELQDRQLKTEKEKIKHDL